MECPRCKGTGKTTCSRCNGTGMENERITSPRGCPLCHGKEEVDCSKCAGKGVTGYMPAV